MFKFIKHELAELQCLVGDIFKQSRDQPRNVSFKLSFVQNSLNECS